MSKDSSTELISRVLSEGLLEIRAIGERATEGAAPDRSFRLRKTVAPVELQAWHIADLLHNSALHVTSATSTRGRTHPDGTPLTGGEDALVEFAILLPHHRNMTHQHDLVLDWAEKTVRKGGWTLDEVCELAAPWLFTPKSYGPDPVHDRTGS